MASGSIVTLLIWLTILSISSFPSYGAITITEELALREILNNHPDLSSVPSWGTLDNAGVYYGRSWNDSFDNLCQNDGFDIYGVYCVGGHVGGLRVTEHWGKSIRDDYPASSGLTYLTNFTNTISTTSSLITVLTNSVSLQHVEAEYAKLGSFSNPSSLLFLSGLLSDSFTFGGMNNLQYLKIGDSSLAPLAPSFSTLCGSSIKELVFENIGFSKFANLVNCLTSLERATWTDVSQLDPTITFSEAIRSSSLKYLSIRSYSSAAKQIECDCSSLEELHLMLLGNVTMNVTAPNLKSLSTSLESLPVTFATFVNLENFEWVGPLMPGQMLPDMSFAPNLRSVSFQFIDVPNTDFNEILASFPTTLEKLELSSLTFATPQQISLPSNWTSLKSLALRELPPRTIDPSSVFSLTSIQELEMRGVEISSLEQIYSLPNLQKLALTSISLTQIPPEFLTRMNKLTYLNLYGPSFQGAIPWAGWENLEDVALFGKFSSWPTIEGTASRLKTLNLYTSDLIIMPTDESFRNANLQNLRTLNIDSSSRLPYFWTNLPNISWVGIASRKYRSPFQTPLTAPRLRSIYLGPGSFCGSLPEFLIPTHLTGLNLDFNYFNGSIPQSWEDNLSILNSLVLSLNLLSGTIPPHLLDHHASYRNRINLASSGLTGPLWNMSTGIPGAFRIDNTGLDICSQDPDIRADPQTISCYISFVPKCPERCPNFWTACAQPLFCLEGPVNRHQSLECSIPDDGCPLPQPGQGFQCNRGTWVLVGNPANITLTLPPSAGPIYIFGNLSTNGTITFSGTGTFLNIEGCLLGKPSQIEIELPSEITESNVTLVTQHGKNCSTDLSQIPIVLGSAKEDCKKTTTVSSSTTPSTLTVVFSIADTCQKSASSQTKWIILGSTVGGILVLLALVCGILHHKSELFRTFVRTCSIRKAWSSRSKSQKLGRTL